MSDTDNVARSLEIEARLNLATPLIRVRGKAPFDHGWQSDPRKWPTLWRGKLSSWTGQLGIPTGLLRDGTYLCVLDCDYYKPGARDSLDRLRDLGLTLRTVSQVTPGHGGVNGEHYLYRSPFPIIGRSLEREGYPGLDLRCVGNQVVLYDLEYEHAPEAPAMLEGPVLDLFAQRSAHNGQRATPAARAQPVSQDERALAILEEHYGAHGARWNGRYFTVTRPGKDYGISATIGEISPGGVHVFTSSWPPLEMEGNYDAHALYKLKGLPDPLVERAKQLSARIPRRAGRCAPQLRALMSETPAAHDWLIEGLLERGDRVVLTAGAGAGKSTLLRQLCVGAALGMNTFSGAPWEEIGPPVRSLIIDLENSRRQLRREFEKLRAVMGSELFERVEHLVHVECRTEGLVLDLTGTAHQADRVWLEETIQGTQPGLVAIGPLYKMQGGRPNDEESSRDLAKFLDALRGRYGFALWLEAHSPKGGEVYPSGSSTWLRWPEFGVHLSPEGIVTHWRGQREERAWPLRFTRSGGDALPGVWPWTPALPSDSGRASQAPRDPHAELIVTCRVEVLRVLHKAGRALTRPEIVERVGRREMACRAAIRGLQDEGAFVLTTEERTAPNGRAYSVELFAIDPAGPWSETPK